MIRGRDAVTAMLGRIITKVKYTHNFILKLTTCSNIAVANYIYFALSSYLYNIYKFSIAILLRVPDGTRAVLFRARPPFWRPSRIRGCMRVCFPKSLGD